MKKKQSFLSRLFGKSKESIPEVAQENKIEEMYEELNCSTEPSDDIEGNMDYEPIDDESVEKPIELKPSTIQVEPVDPSVIKIAQDRPYTEITSSIQKTIEDFMVSRTLNNSNKAYEEIWPVEYTSEEQESIQVETQPEEVVVEETNNEETQPEEVVAEDAAIEETEQEDVIAEEVAKEEPEPEESITEETIEEQETEVTEPEFTTFEDIKFLSEKYNGVVIDGPTVYNEYSEKRTSIKALKTELIKDASIVNGLQVYFGNTSTFNQVIQVSNMMKLKSIHVKPTEVAGNLVFQYELKTPNPGAGDVLKAMTEVLLSGCSCLSCVSETSAHVDDCKVSVSVSFDMAKVSDILGVRVFSISRVIEVMEEKIK